MRNPVKICGNDAGNRMRVNSARRLKPLTSPSSISLRSTPRIPATTLSCTGKKRTDGDERDFRRFVDTHPQQQDRHPCQRRNRPQCLKRGIEQRVEAAAQAHCRADQQRERSADAKAREHAQRACADMAAEALGAELPERLDRSNWVPAPDAPATPTHAPALRSVREMPAAGASPAMRQRLSGSRAALARCAVAASARRSRASDSSVAMSGDQRSQRRVDVSRCESDAE